jgi:lysozyme
MKKLLILLLLPILLLSLLGTTTYFKKHNPSPTQTLLPTIATPKKEPNYLKGLDLSKYNGNVNFKVLKEKSNIGFIFTKATEANYLVDSKLQENLSKGKKEGIMVGAYHFYTLCLDGKTQALHYINNVKRESINLPPVIDLELYRNCKPAKSMNASKEISIYLNTIEKYYKHKPIIYTTIDFYHEYKGKVNFLDYPLWLRVTDRDINSKDYHNIFGIEYETEIRKVWEEKWSFWQFNDKGRVEGVKGEVDVNYFRYGLEGLRKL